MLTFQKEGHIYRWNDKIVPSVTQILTDVGLNDSFLDEYCADRGRRIHLACQLHDENDLDESSIGEEVRGYLEQYKKAVKELNCQIIVNEKQYYSQILNFAGMIDRIIKLHGQGYRYIADIKTGVVTKSASYQLAGYRLLALENGIEVARKGYVIQLSPDTYKIHEYQLSGYNEEFFRAAIIIYHAKRR